jgi:cytochrome P450
MPVIDRFVVKNPLVKPFLGAPPFAWGFKQAYADVAARKAMHAAAHTSPGSSDFLDLFLAARDAYPDIVTGDDVVVNYLFLFLVAGSDTTGTVLAAILYYVYRDPAILAKLRAELATVCDGSAPIKYRDGVKLPYFDAVVHEGLRIHPPIGLAFERVVPAGGWQMPEGGPLLPPGVKVGVNAWVSNRDEKTFGPEDVDGFVPERWLARDGETAEEWSSRASRMKHLLFTFGYGSRICTGKSVALLELVKLVGTFVVRYDVSDFAVLLAPRFVRLLTRWFGCRSSFLCPSGRRRIFGLCSPRGLMSR